MKRFFLFFVIFIFLIGLYSRYIETNMFTIKEYSISKSVPNTFKDLQIIHFSDTLINNEFSIADLDSLVEEINILNPDIVFFTGDLIDKNFSLSDDEIIEVSKILSNIDVSLYKFAVYGDNDLSNESTYSTIMNSGDFLLLDNETFTLFYKDNTPITITGITDLNELNYAYETEIDTSNSLNITLTHKPDNFSSLSNADIVIAGHYLGGYIKLPFIGATFHKAGSETYYDDYLSINNQLLFISNGIGTENYHFRFNNVPSINIYKFV